VIFIGAPGSTHVAKVVDNLLNKYNSSTRVHENFLMDAPTPKG
jgi:hypothetical protein